MNNADIELLRKEIKRYARINNYDANGRISRPTLSLVQTIHNEFIQAKNPTIDMFTVV